MFRLRICWPDDPNLGSRVANILCCVFLDLEFSYIVTPIISICNSFRIELGLIFWTSNALTLTSNYCYVLLSLLCPYDSPQCLKSLQSRSTSIGLNQPFL